MPIVDFALEHARQGRLVFPGVPNSKIPAIKDPYKFATTDELQIITWWQEDPTRNICLPGGYEIAPGKFIGYIDIDTKTNGFKTLAELDILGFEFPETLAQNTPSGGLHLFYYFDFPIQNSAGFLGPGIDTRGFHGYVIGAGSGINGKGYVFKNRLQVTQAPDWLARRLFRGRSLGGTGSEAGKRVLSVVHGIDEEACARRSREYLLDLPTAREGERNRKGFEAACKIKDQGCSRELSFELLSTVWKCEPVLEPTELNSIINSAHKNGQNTPGIDAPENAFDPIPPPVEVKPKHPFDAINDEYALVTAGGGVRILWETMGDKDEDRVEHLSLDAFHTKLANVRYTVAEKTISASKAWLASKQRREYQGIIFRPKFNNPKFFNVWRGFTLSGRAPNAAAHQALEFFLRHILENVCGNNQEWANWVLGFFAHLIQYPEKKPRVALALRGRKGVGKNVITECVGRLLGGHYLLAANRRYLSGNFNAHLENKLLFVLDEAYWSGDKAAEGVLKDLITGSTQQIERKGHESYSVANLMRIVIFGNEEWIVPATADERRFAVFEVGDGNRRDDDFFGVILDGMKEHGGDQLLFKYLAEFDLSKVDVNRAPDTDALAAQKEQTLDPFEAWWYSCLQSGTITGDLWPAEISKEVFRSTFQKELEAQNNRSRLPNAVHIGRSFKKMSPKSVDKVKRQGEIFYRVYELAPLETARLEWEKFIGGRVKWDELKE